MDSQGSDDCCCQKERNRTSSNEYFMSIEPVNDFYSSDDDKKERKTNRAKCNTTNQEKFLHDEVIKASSILPWEMDYFLGINYEVRKPVQYRKEPKVENLVEEAFQFLYPKGVPEFYKQKYGSGIPWKMAIRKMCDDFFSECKDHQWFRENFIRDYTKDENCPLMSIFPQNVNLSVKNNWKKVVFKNDPDVERSVTLAGRIHKVMQLIIADENGDTSEDRDSQYRHTQEEKYEKIRGMISEVMSYLKIPIMHKGESKLDFVYSLLIPHRQKEQGDVQFKIRPDITLCTKTFPDEDPVPFCTVQIYASDGIQKTEKSSNEQPQSRELLDTCNLDQPPSLRQMYNGNNSDSNCNKNDNTKELKCVTYVKNAYDEKLATTYKSSLLSVYFNTDLQEKIMGKIRKKVPFSTQNVSDSDVVLQKLSAQLSIAMYGLLVCRATSFEKAQHKYQRLRFIEESERKRVGLGLFVMNDRVYLSRISHDVYYLFQSSVKGQTRAEVENGPSVCYTDWYFSFKRPEDRLALMVFLHHYKNIMMKKYTVDLWD